MTEAAHALGLLRREISITDEVLGALKRCRSGTVLDTSARKAIKHALLLLQAEEAKLFEAKQSLAVHQQLHAKVESLQGQIRTWEKRAQDCGRQLTKADVALRGPLEDAKRLLEAGRKAEAAEVSINDVVDYAQRISGITSAPSYWKPGMAMVGFAPPAPRPEMMRAGALSALADATGNSLTAADLQKLARDLEGTRKKTANENRTTAIDSATGGSESGSSGENREREPDSDRRGEASPSKSKSTGKRSAQANNGEGPGSGFAHMSPLKRPKISLDLDDLDSDSDEADESE